MFKPSVPSTIFLFALAALFAGLGNWQLERKAEKEALFEQFDNAPALGIGRALERNERFARIEAWGRFDTERHLLLDNRMFRGRAGVHVLTPFILGDGQVILVNRGWLPLPPDRSEGRFMLQHDGFLDPEVFAKGRTLTAAGEVTGVIREMIDHEPYDYILLASLEIHLWERAEDLYRYPYPYRSPLYDPWYHRHPSRRYR